MSYPTLSGSILFPHFVIESKDDDVIFSFFNKSTVNKIKNKFAQLGTPRKSVVKTENKIVHKVPAQTKPVKVISTSKGASQGPQGLTDKSKTGVSFWDGKYSCNDNGYCPFAIGTFPISDVSIEIVNGHVKGEVSTAEDISPAPSSGCASFRGKVLDDGKFSEMSFSCSSNSFVFRGSVLVTQIF